LIFFLCIPFLNILIGNIKEKMHIRLIMIGVFTYVIMGSVPITKVTMNYVSWFIVLYFIASYIRLYPKKVFENTALWGALSALSLLLSSASILVLNFLCSETGRNRAYYLIDDSNKILALSVALCAFLFFKNVKIPYSKFINTVSASTYGVLLIHANGRTRQWLWYDLLDCVGAYDSKYLILHAVCSVAVIYIVCTVIDYLRINLIEKPCMKLWDNAFPKILDRYTRIENRICKIFNINS